MRAMRGIVLGPGLALVAVSAPFASGDTPRECKSFRFECTEWDPAGEICKRWESVPNPECTDAEWDRLLGVRPPKVECFERIEHGATGTCRKAPK